MKQVVDRIGHKRLLCVFLFALMLITVVQANFGEEDARDPVLSYGKRGEYFKSFTMECFDGGTFTQDDLDGYDLILVNVWEPYCVSCVEEMPALTAVSERNKEKGLLVIGVQGNACLWPEDNVLAVRLAKEAGVTYPMVFADQVFTNELLPLLNSAFPGTFLLDGNGSILDLTMGAKTETEWLEYLNGYLAGSL